MNEPDPLALDLKRWDEHRRRKIEKSWNERKRRRRLVHKVLPVEVTRVALRDLPRWVREICEGLARDGEYG